MTDIEITDELLEGLDRIAGLSEPGPWWEEYDEDADVTVLLEQNENLFE